jgi:D-tyrosyl-tRNA(Tyr) deacylase
MRVVIQRVTQAAIFIGEELHTSILHGMAILLGIEEQDTSDDIGWLVNKLTALRIYSDSEGKMNLSIADVQGEFLVVSQFTLHASTKKGNRPSFIKAAKPDIAKPMYEHFIESLRVISGLKVSSGVFAADMKISLTNDGPVTIIIDTKQRE